MGFWSWLFPKKNLEINSVPSVDNSNPVPIVVPDSQDSAPAPALMLTPAPAPVQDPLVDRDVFMEDLRYIVRSFFDSRKPTLFYAWLCGYEYEVAGEGDYYVLVMSPPKAISQKGIAFAIEKLKSDLEGMYFEYWESSIKDYHARMVSPSSAADLERVLSKYSKDVFSEAFERYRSEVASFAVNLVSSRRDMDIGNLNYKIEEKWQYLKPILRNALLAGVDKYGDQSYEKFHDECRQFTDKLIPENTLKFYSANLIWAAMGDIVFLKLEEEPVGSSREIPVDGVEFEIWCAERFIELGWDAQLTTATGDQGVDVIVRKDNLTVAVQCKRYSQPVGNKAVQEAYAGKQHIGADIACVIATAGFTKSAVELARSTLVYLVEADDIDIFAEHITKEIEA